MKPAAEMDDDELLTAVYNHPDTCTCAYCQEEDRRYLEQMGEPR